MSSSSDSILDMYLYETNTLLEQLDEIILEAERANTFSPSDVNEIFRIMHTVKGSSAMMEFSTLMEVAHHIEDLFFVIREHGMDCVAEAHRSALFDLMFQAVDYFRGEVEKVEKENPLSQDIDSLLQKINSLLSKIKGEEPKTQEEKFAPPSAPEPEAPVAPAPTMAAPLPCSSDYPYSLLVFFDEGCGMENLRAFMLVNSVRNFCHENAFRFVPEEVEGHPEASEIIIEKGFLLEFKNAEDRGRAIPMIMGSGSVRTYQTADAPPRAVAETAQPQSSAAPAAAKASPEAATGGPHSKESLISVNLSKLDQLMAVVGEIVITESMVTSSPDLKGMKLDNFTKSARQLRKLTDELQDVSMALRMVPVSATFQKMNRIVRDMGKKLGKRTRLVLVGEDTEVDKTVVDSIGDPIMHIVRNSMDHGIEEHEEERTSKGKDPVGEIVLSARHTGGEVIIEVRDDGQGVDDEAVLRKACRNGLANPDVEYSHKDILNFLIAPGFSTNEAVTEFSGRGVGMDVVKKNIEEVGGTISISSERGQGMTTTLKIPLTMAIMDGMEVSVGSSIFTIPINNIRQTFKINSDEIIYDSARGEIIKCMDSFYPLLRIKDVYRLGDGHDAVEDGILLWVESGEVSYCLFVDELIGEQQVVVKPFPAYVNAFNIKDSGFTGCTILGDGNISIIVDIANLYSKFG